jgi:hypothetical protein
MKFKKNILLLAVFFFAFKSFFAQYPVKWQQIVGCSYNSSTNVLTKNTANGWTSGALSYNNIKSGQNGIVSYTVTSIATFSQLKYLGLSPYNTGANFNTIKYGVGQDGAQFRVVESGTVKYTLAGGVQVGDILSVERTGANVYYSRTRAGTKTILYTSILTISTTEVLYADCSIFYNGISMASADANFGYITISEAITNIDFNNNKYYGNIQVNAANGASPYTFSWASGTLGNKDSNLIEGTYQVTATDNVGGVEVKSINVDYLAKWQQFAGCTVNSTTNVITKNVALGWCNTGGISKNKLKSGRNGYVEYKIERITSFQMYLGLADYNTNACNTSIKFAIFQDNSTFRVSESGVTKYSLTSGLQVNDIVGVERVGTNVYYYRIRSGVKSVLYTSILTINPNEDLYADFSINTASSTMKEIRTSFGWDWATENTKISDLTSGISGVLPTNGDFGKSVVNAGDIDENGFDDLIVSYDYDANNRGGAYILFMGASNAVLSISDISANTGLSSLITNDSLVFNVVKTFPDLNRDGKREFYASAIRKKHTGYDIGSSPVINQFQGKGYIFQLTKFGTIEWLKECSPVTRMLELDTTGPQPIEMPMIFDRFIGNQVLPMSQTIENFDSIRTSVRVGNLFGYSASAIGDVDGNGTDDIAISSIYESSLTSSSKEGGITILFLDRELNVINYAEINPYSGGLSNNPNTNDYFGFDIVAIDDYDSDGIKEIAVSGANIESGNYNGKVWIISLNPNGTTKDDFTINSTDVAVKTNSFFGAHLDVMGDLNGDGLKELAISSIYSIKHLDKFTFPSNLGQLSVISISSTNSVKLIKEIYHKYNGLGTLVSNDRFSNGMAYLGNMNNNGKAYIAVGASGDDAGGTNKGAIYLLKLDEAVISRVNSSNSITNVTTTALGAITATISGGQTPYNTFFENNEYLTNYQFNTSREATRLKAISMGLDGSYFASVNRSVYLNKFNSNSVTGLDVGIYNLTIVDALENKYNKKITLTAPITILGSSPLSVASTTVSKGAGSAWSEAIFDNYTSLMENGGFEVEITNSTTQFYVGLREYGDTITYTNPYESLVYGLWVNSGILSVIINGEIEGTFTINTNDKIELTKSSNSLKFHRNGVLFKKYELDDSSLFGENFRGDKNAALQLKAGIYTASRSFKLVNYLTSKRPRIVASGQENMNCGQLDNGELNPVITGTLSSLIWTGPNSFTSSSQQISGLEPGEYTLTVTSGSFTQVKKYWVGYKTLWVDKTDVLNYPFPNNNSIYNPTFSGMGEAYSANSLVYSASTHWQHFGLLLPIRNKLTFDESAVYFKEDISVSPGIFGVFLWDLPINYKFLLAYDKNTYSLMGLFQEFSEIHITKTLSAQFSYTASNLTPLLPLPWYTITPFNGSNFSSANLIVGTDLRGKTEISNHLVSFPCEPNVGYVKPHVKLDGGYYLPTNNKLYLYFDKEYEPNIQNCEIKIYKEHTNQLYETTQIHKKSIGDNRHIIDLGALTGTLTNGHYILELINTKGDVVYLKFNI